MTKMQSARRKYHGDAFYPRHVQAARKIVIFQAPSDKIFIEAVDFFRVCFEE